jgi:two-component system, OmpR family, response regulator
MIYKKPLSVGLVADVCRVSKKTVLNWIYDGGLKAFTTYGGHYRVWPSNLKKFLDTTGMDIPFDFLDERTTNLLIIDDDADYAQMLKSAVKAELPNVEVTATDDGYEGLVMIGEIKPQVVILDIRMPKVDGMQVLELLKNRKVDHEMKILVVSAYLDDKTRKQLKTTVADYALDKLTDVDVLVKTIVALVRSEKPAFLDEQVDK